MSVNITDPSSGPRMSSTPRRARPTGTACSSQRGTPWPARRCAGWEGHRRDPDSDGAVVVTSRELEAARRRAGGHGGKGMLKSRRGRPPPGGGRGMSGSFATFDGGGFLPAKLRKQAERRRKRTSVSRRSRASRPQAHGRQRRFPPERLGTNSRSRSCRNSGSRRSCRSSFSRSTPIPARAKRRIA